jgi:hypothetical protein
VRNADISRATQWISTKIGTFDVKRYIQDNIAGSWRDKAQSHRRSASAVGITLSPEDSAYLEEPYVPHKLVGVMSFNHK